MPRSSFITFLVAAICYALPTVNLAADIAAWPQWRGEEQNGVAEEANYPLRWSEESAIQWKIPLPGRGGSTPVVGPETVYLTTGAEGNNTLLAIDANSGSVNWRTQLGADRGEKHKKGSGSNPSPLLDVDRVYAYFRSGDLGCVDLDGNVIWQVNLQAINGEDSLWWDLGSSPLLTDTAIVVAVMQSGPSYVAAYDKQTGDEIWKVDRILDAPNEAAQSYTTPLAVQVAGVDAIAVLGADHLTLHRADDGTEIGRVGGFNPTRQEFFRSIASPVAAGDIIVCPYARGSTLTGIRLSKVAAGDDQTAIAWYRDDLGSDVPTPAAVDGKVYVVGDGGQNKGLISGLDIETGNTLWSLRLEKSRHGFTSSPLVAGDHLYVTREDATTFVIGPLSSSQPQLVATNEIADNEQFTVASPVPIAGDLLLRSRNQLYRISGQLDRTAGDQSQ
jgi:outer membrane protein assembly factor BamB